MKISDGNLSRGISVCLLAYKEEENLRILIPQIRKQLERIGEQYEIIVVDSQSPLDATPEVCRQYNCRYINQELPGFGGAFRTGIKYAGYDKFLIMDSDGSHNPRYICRIYNAFIQKRADVVIGSRYVKGGSTNDKKSSVVMSHMLNLAFRVALGIKARDISTDYRMYHTKDLKEVKLKGTNFEILQEVLLKIKLGKSAHRIRIYEVPIKFEKRLYGQSKRQLFKFIIGYVKTLFRLTGLRIIYSISGKR